ncbi:MAG: hypothetical protein WAK53_11260 [Chromatiaceae bacterium]
MSPYRAIVSLILTCLLAGLLVGCGKGVDDPISASSLAKGGFARSDRAVRDSSGREIRVRGFVDHRNLYGDASARQILDDWWSGEGPSATSWRFDLKGRADDEPGHGFPVHVPNDAGRDGLLRAFLADARENRPTKVLVQGRLHTFEAPLNAITLTGLYLEARSAQAIRIEPQDSHWQQRGISLAPVRHEVRDPLTRIP